jgi:hypothetical protein
MDLSTVSLSLSLDIYIRTGPPGWGISNLKQKNIVMSLVGLGPEKTVLARTRSN